MKPGVGCRARELVDEQFFQPGLADVDGAATSAAVVVRVVVATPFRPARRQRPSARLATDVPAQREVRIVSLSRSSHLVPTVENRLDAEEDPFGYKQIEISASRDSEILHVDPADVDVVSQHRVERL